MEQIEQIIVKINSIIIKKIYNNIIEIFKINYYNDLLTMDSQGITDSQFDYMCSLNYYNDNRAVYNSSMYLNDPNFNDGDW